MVLNLKLFFIGLVLFFLFYLEPIYVFGIKFAHLWKLVLMLFFITSVKFNIVRNKITLLSLWYYIKFLFTTGSLFLGYWGDAFYMLIRGSTIPLFNNYLQVKKIDTPFLWRFLNFLASFTVLSAVPFLLGIINPISDGYILEGYGSDQSGFIGVFQNPHGAAIVFSQALLIIFFNVVYQKKIKVLSIILFIIGVFVLYKTYVRTGFAMFIVGILIILIKEYGIRKLHKVIFLVVLFSIPVSYIYKNDEAFQGRLKQERVYPSNTETTIDKISSGRLTLASVNLKNYITSDPFSIVFGLGYQYSADLMYQDIKQRKVSHNGYVDALVHNGLIGLLLFLLLLRAFYKVLVNNRKSNYYSLGLASFYSYLAFNMFQGGSIFFIEIEILIILYIIKYYRIETNEA